jgi:predicted transcriptional regulator
MSAHTHLLIPENSNKHKPAINVKRIVKDTCCVYMEKGRLSNTASKLIMTKPKCKRVTK